METYLALWGKSLSSLENLNILLVNYHYTNLTVVRPSLY